MKMFQLRTQHFSFFFCPFYFSGPYEPLSVVTHQTLLVHVISDALRTILKEEGWCALYRGIAPSLFLVSFFFDRYPFSCKL